MHARDLAKGTLAAIIEVSGVGREEFLRRAHCDPSPHGV